MVEPFASRREPRADLRDGFPFGDLSRARSVAKAHDARCLSAVVSVHDVMPERLPDVFATLSLLKQLGVPAPVLLVVPGRRWNEKALRAVAKLERQGYALAGHGWSHEATSARTRFHKLHGTLISKDAAEHLSRTRATVREIISNCYEWFVRTGLRAPELYVPPAWAMGQISRAELRTLPFARYETLSGVYDAWTNEFRRLPLVGFEATSPARVASLRAWNAINIAWARGSRRPLRIAIHPADLRLGLARDLKRLLSRCARFLDERQAAHEAR